MEIGYFRTVSKMGRIQDMYDEIAYKVFSGEDMKKPATKAESKYMSRVSELGCIVCRNEHGAYHSAEIHHIRHGAGMSQRAGHHCIIPLCPSHHRGGHGVGIHGGRQTFESMYGTEMDLLDQTISLVTK